jgi:hypothetical protein
MVVKTLPPDTPNVLLAVLLILGNGVPETR